MQSGDLDFLATSAKIQTQVDLPVFQKPRRIQQAVLELADVLQGAAAGKELHLLGVVLQNLHPYQQSGNQNPVAKLHFFITIYSKIMFLDLNQVYY